jgi:ferric-chelate reductase
MAVTDPLEASLQPLIPTFAALLQQVAFVDLRISVHYTRASGLNTRKVYAHLPPQLSITPGRPKIASVIDSTIDHACKLFAPSGREYHVSDKLSGIFVGVCGPLGLGGDVRKAVSTIETRRFTNVGGIEVFEETFGW